jgi:uncharacterized protein YpmB
MPGSGVSEIYFIAAMMVLILLISAAAVYFFFKQYRKEAREKAERLAKNASDGMPTDPQAAVETRVRRQ